MKHTGSGTQEKPYSSDTAGHKIKQESPSVETERPLTIACHMKKV